MATVTIVVNGLAGPRCSIEAPADWTILQVHGAIAAKIGLPADWQTLVKDTERLAWEVIVGSLLSDDPGTLQLTLLVKEEPGALLASIERRDEATALLLLQRQQLPGLNNVDREGQTVLYRAIQNQLQEVALTIVARADFEGINAKTNGDWTALHQAARRGNLPVCRALLERHDFTEGLAVNGARETASQVAERNGYRKVRDVLRAAEELKRSETERFLAQVPDER